MPWPGLAYFAYFRSLGQTMSSVAFTSFAFRTKPLTCSCTIEFTMSKDSETRRQTACRDRQNASACRYKSEMHERSSIGKFLEHLRMGSPKSFADWYGLEIFALTTLFPARFENSFQTALIQRSFPQRPRSDRGASFIQRQWSQRVVPVAASMQIQQFRDQGRL